MAEDSPVVLVVDDDASVCWAVEQALSAEGYRVVTAADARAAKRAIKRDDPDLVFTDVRMSGQSGLDLLADLRDGRPQLPVIVMTAYGTMETAIEAVQRGAFEYLAKPIDLESLVAVTRRALGEHTVAVAARPDADDPVSAIIGSSPAMQEVYRRVAAAAGNDLSVLIVGPSGSGKELVARALHRHSARRDGPFIAVNCGALPDNLVESELFGHEAGAFTDARQRKPGRVEAADGGVLFLDEVGELPPASQVKLLRFLEEHRFSRVGGAGEVQVDVRVIAATNRDLQQAMEQGSFRSDLGYRLRVITIELPPLARRRADIPELARYFLERTAVRLGRRLALTADAERRLQEHAWPGNVRELRHALEEAAVMSSGGVISTDDLVLDGAPDRAATGGDLETALRTRFAAIAEEHPGEVHRRIGDEVERVLIDEALARTRGNQLRAAELLGINRITLKKRKDQLGSTP